VNHPSIPTNAGSARVKRILGYAVDTEVSLVSAQEGEIMAFTVANTYLRECSDPFSRTKALHKNQQLWSMLVKDIMLSHNQLPQYVKDDLIRLGCWAMAYSIRAMGADLPLAPLIAVNSDMIDALRRQIQNSATTAQTPPRSANGAV